MSLFIIGSAHFFAGASTRQSRNCSSRSRRIRVPAPLSLSRRLLCSYGSARRGARDRRAAAGHYPCRDTGRQLPAERRAPRAFPVGPAPGGRRGDMSQTRRLAAILTTVSPSPESAALQPWTTVLGQLRPAPGGQTNAPFRRIAVVSQARAQGPTAPPKPYVPNLSAQRRKGRARLRPMLSCSA